MSLSLQSLLLLLVIGLIAGWLAARLVRGNTYSLPVNVIVGVIGSFIGGWLFSVLGIHFHGIIGQIIAATVGAVLLLVLGPVDNYLPAMMAAARNQLAL